MGRNIGETWGKNLRQSGKAYFDVDAGTCPKDANNLRFDDKQFGATSRAEIYRYNDTK